MVLAWVDKLSDQKTNLKIYYHFASIPCYMTLLKLLLNLSHALALRSTSIIPSMVIWKT